MKSIVAIVYIVIGILVAAQKDYLGNIGSIGDIINLLLAVLLWPLVLLGVKFNISVGGGGGGGDKKGSLLIPAALHHLNRLRKRTPHQKG